MRNGRTPVLIGVGHYEQRVDDFEAGLEPLDMMLEAIRLAAADCGRPDVATRADALYVIRGIWPYANPGRVVADRIGAKAAVTVETSFGGNMVQSCVNDAAQAITRGELEIALFTGAENGRSFASARKKRQRLRYSEAPGKADRSLGNDEAMMHALEKERGIVRPIQIYPIFENALRSARGESIDAHLRRISELWARFNAVATLNPSAWIREPLSAEEIRTPSPSNRMIGFPYPKLMNSNSAVDQAAALILCSLDAAESLGIDPDRFVFLHAGSDAHDHYYVSERDDLVSSPAIRIAGRRALELAGTTAAEVDHVDLYSCFPSAVQVAAKELGFDEQRPLTVTGGLTFGGGPMNNYVMHSIARMAQVLRGDPGSTGLVTANGGYLTKHAFGVYSTLPPEDGFRYDRPQAAVDALPRRAVAGDHDGEVTIESYTVMFDDDGPAIGHTACLTRDGRRTWANTHDRGLAAAMTGEEFCGRPARVDAAGELHAR